MKLQAELPPPSFPGDGVEDLRMTTVVVVDAASVAVAVLGSAAASGNSLGLGLSSWLAWLVTWLN